jgi:hypothetical protein
MRSSTTSMGQDSKLLGRGQLQLDGVLPPFTITQARTRFSAPTHSIARLRPIDEVLLSPILHPPLTMFYGQRGLKGVSGKFFRLRDDRPASRPSRAPPTVATNTLIRSRVLLSGDPKRTSFELHVNFTPAILGRWRRPSDLDPRLPRVLTGKMPSR